MNAPVLHRDATLSDCGLYRYWLIRSWDTSLPRMVFIMLNPSTADALADDPTIRRCMAFARREGCGGIVVVNLLAYRATDPKMMKGKHITLLFGDRNNGYLKDALLLGVAGKVVCAWGAIEERLLGLADNLRGWAIREGVKLYCLGTTKADQPRHPLYLRSDAELEPWP